MPSAQAELERKYVTGTIPGGLSPNHLATNLPLSYQGLLCCFYCVQHHIICCGFPFLRQLSSPFSEMWVSDVELSDTCPEFCLLSHMPVFPPSLLNAFSKPLPLTISYLFLYFLPGRTHLLIVSTDIFVQIPKSLLRNMYFY